MPDRWPRKLSAVRSAVRIDASGPSTVPIVVPPSTRAPSATAHDVAPTSRPDGTTRGRTACRRRHRWLRTTTSARADRSGGSSADVRSPSGRQVLGQRPGHGIDHRVPRWFERARRTDRRHRESPPRCAAATGAGTSTMRRRNAGSVSRWSARVWAPRLSVRVVAAASNARATSTRLASSQGGSRLGRGQSGGDPLDHRGGRRQRAGVAQHPGALGHRPLEVAQGNRRIVEGRRRRDPTRRPRRLTRRVHRRATGRSPALDPQTADHLLVGGRGRRSRPASRRSAQQRSRPRSMASTTRAPNTMPSSSELEARRLAPCTPEQATSPAAHSPGSDGGAVEVGDHTAAEVVGGRRDGQPVGRGVEPDAGQRGADGRESARRTTRGRWRRATGGRRRWSSMRRGDGAGHHVAGQQLVDEALALARRGSSAPWPRSASDSSGRGICGMVQRGRVELHELDVGHAAPARSAIAMPSPVLSTGLVVTENSWPAPPVASSTLRARTIGAPRRRRHGRRRPGTVRRSTTQVERERRSRARRPRCGAPPRPAPARSRRRWPRRRRGPPGAGCGRPRGPARGGPARRGRTSRPGRSAR